MDRNEQQLIDDLFANLAEVERNSGPRDAEAERYIGQLMSRQPGAPYFMTQSLVLQEQQLRAAQARIAELERGVGQGQGGGSFLGGARAGGGSVPAAGGQFRYPAPPSSYEPAPSRYEQPPQRAPEPQPEPQRGGGVGGFLTGVAQTAAGVAGGMMLGNMLGGLFGGGHSSHSTPHSTSASDATPSHEMEAAHQIEKPDYQDTSMQEADFAGQDFGGFDDIDI